MISEAARRAQRKWRAKNRDKCRQYTAKWKEKNPGKAEVAQKVWREANPEKNKSIVWKSRLKSQYGLTPEQYEEILVAQEHACAICGVSKPGGRAGWHIDHCHATNQVRGILCHMCNIMLGHARDNRSILGTAIAYLAAHEERASNFHPPSTTGKLP